MKGVMKGEEKGRKGVGRDLTNEGELSWDWKEGRTGRGG